MVSQDLVMSNSMIDEFIVFIKGVLSIFAIELGKSAQHAASPDIIR